MSKKISKLRTDKEIAKSKVEIQKEIDEIFDTKSIAKYVIPRNSVKPLYESKSNKPPEKSHLLWSAASFEMLAKARELGKRQNGSN